MILYLPSYLPANAVETIEAHHTLDCTRLGRQRHHTPVSRANSRDSLMSLYPEKSVVACPICRPWENK